MKPPYSAGGSLYASQWEGKLFATVNRKGVQAVIDMGCEFMTGRFPKPLLRYRKANQRPAGRFFDKLCDPFYRDDTHGLTPFVALPIRT